MHLTTSTLHAWATTPPYPSGSTLIRLEDGDSMPANPGTLVVPVAPNIEGPALVELVVFRDGGWSAREMVYETPESIALAASDAQRRRKLTPVCRIPACGCTGEAHP